MKPPSIAEMKRFLKEEGWERYPSRIVDAYWEPGKRNFLIGILDAYRIAKRRKAARERAALKRAKALFFEPTQRWYTLKNGWWTELGKTRSEALAKLAEAAKPSHPKSKGKK